MSEEFDDFLEDLFEFGGWSYTPQEKECIRTKKDISQRGRSEILENLRDVSIRFYGQVLTQYKIETEKLAKKVYEERLDYEVSRDNELQISENDYKQLFLKELATIDGERKNVEEEHEIERLKTKNHLVREYQSYILNKLEQVEWTSLKPTIDAKIDAKSRFATRTLEEISKDAAIEMVEQDYVNAYVFALTDLCNYLKEESKSAVYKRYREKVRTVLSCAGHSKFNFSEWSAFIHKHNIFHSEESEYTGINPYKLYSNREVTDSIIYWAEWEIYDSLNQASPTNTLSDWKYLLDKVKYAAQYYFDNRTPDEIIRDNKAFVTVEDYFTWCVLVWEDIDYSKWRDAENEQYRIEQEYFSNNLYYDDRSSNYDKYGGPSDGYGGRLNDDYIDDALGGQPDAHWNLD